ncbi:MAG TPA: DUF1385 domain-containing protein [Firmicutes bacterium]|nr:DUF1385 domain-containing protein [Bacillota bacterium]
MMRGMNKIAMAVRLPDGSIDLEELPAGDLAHPKWYRRIPIIRGVINFIDSMAKGYTCLMKSAEKSGMDDTDEEPSKFEKKLTELFGDNLMKVMAGIGMVLGVGLAILLFMYLPALFVQGLSALFPLSNILRSLIEGIIKIIIFVGYLALVSQMKDIRRTFEYHGAEHKSIFCYEHGDELTVENVRRYQRFHPRCGTSFMIIVLILSILIFSVVTWDNLVIRILLKLALLPIVVGISYELIKFAGRHDNLVTRIISAPGMALQHLTTREPDDSQLEVAIAALKEVLPVHQGEDRW